MNGRRLWKRIIKTVAGLLWTVLLGALVLFAVMPARAIAASTQEGG